MSNTLYQIFMDADATFSPTSPSTSSVRVDPVIELDPEFAADFTIVTSPGIGNAVPETSIWAMLLAGFAGLGAIAYSRSKADKTRAAA